MRERIKTIQFQGEAGTIDCALDWPDEGQALQGWALILHPHPLHGGARDNKVVTTMSRAAVQQGLLAVRPNFRGVGLSAGQFDKAVGETADMLALVEQFTQQYTDLAQAKWALAGFSFGTAVAAQLYSALREQQRALPQALILAGPAVERFRFRELSLPEDTLLIHGEADEVVPLSEAMDFARAQGLPITLLPDSSHFFHGRLLTLRQLVAQRLATLGLTL